MAMQSTTESKTATGKLPELPVWLRKIADHDDLDRIHLCVEKTEVRTSAEIVPMIVRRSILTGHVAPLLFLFLVLVFWTVTPSLALITQGFPGWAVSLGGIMLAGVLTLLMKDVDFWQRHLTSKKDQALSTLHRAQLEFYHSGINATAHATGVLIFVSLLEKRAVILVDKAIADSHAVETWDGVVAALLVRVRAGDFAGGMCTAIETVGQLLEKQFPHREEDHVLLPNVLAIKE
jgi:putative membrane protein